MHEHFRDGNHVFSDLLATAPARFRLAGDRLDAEVADGEVCRRQLLLGARPAAGRRPAARTRRRPARRSHVRGGGRQLAMLEKRFSLDPAALGAQITINEAPMTIVGVAPREFFGLQIGIQTDVWIPRRTSRSFSPRPARDRRAAGEDDRPAQAGRVDQEALAELQDPRSSSARRSRQDEKRAVPARLQARGWSRRPPASRRCAISSAARSPV